ncbi:MAG: hypothetical protein ABIO86_17630 [Sphingomonas sp.]
MPHSVRDDGAAARKMPQTDSVSFTHLGDTAVRVGKSTGAIFTVVMLAACKPATAPAEGQNATVAPTLLPALPAPTGLSASDQAAIKADAKARLLTRTIGFTFNSTKHLCTDFFSLGDPQVSDAALGERTGKVKLIIPVSVYNPQTINGQMTAPDMGCYGYSHPGWHLNEPFNVEFQFDVEHWQTGWRVSQVQANGF